MYGKLNVQDYIEYYQVKFYAYPCLTFNTHLIAETISQVNVQCRGATNALNVGPLM